MFLAGADFLSQFRSLDRPARLFMGVTVLGGILTSMWMLFFNFYILKMGFDRQFLGLINSVSAMAALVFGIPMGLFSDQIGRKKAILIGIGIFSIASTLELLVTNRYLLLLLAFLSSVGGTLHFLNIAPFLMKVSRSETRTYVFSLNFGLSILAGVIGNLIAGQASSLFGGILQVSSTSITAYRATLLSALSLDYLAFALMVFIKEPGFENADSSTRRVKTERQIKSIFVSLRKLITQPIVLKLALVQIVLGFGVAILSPYMNLFFHEKFFVSDRTLGLIFGVKSLMTGLGSMMVPKLERIFRNRIKMVAFSQFLGGISLLVMGFSPGLPLAIFGFLLGGVFLLIPIPVMNAFSMEQVDESQQATLGSVRELSWQASWGIGPYISGILQDRQGFSPVFVLSVCTACFSAALHNHFFRKSDQHCE